MYWKNRKTKKIFYLSIVLVVLGLNFFMINFNNTPNTQNNEKRNSSFINLHEKVQENLQEIDLKSQGIIEDEFTNEWLQNGNFTTGTDPWYNTTEGDGTDVNATYSAGAANYEIKGENGIFELYEDPPTASNWTRTLNPNFPSYPDTATITSEGAYVSHFWNEGADQSVSANWEHNVTMPVNMDEYEITSASLEAVVNATVTTYSAQPYSDGIEAGNDYIRTTQYATGDYVRFYVLISDRNKNNVYEVAYNQTSDLGQDSPVISQMGDTFMVTVPEETLMFYLTSVLSADYYNFTVILGIRIWCEDNFAQDSDTFDDVLINSINLTFTYEKKIDQLTSLSWNQIGNEIPSGVNVGISKAVLNFSYQINETWSPLLSPNSEIRMIINNTQHSESIKLSDISTGWQESSFDVTYAVLTTGKGVNISLSIQVYLADEFILDRVIKISIDNVSLEITYTVGTVEEETELELFLNGINKTLDKSIDVPWRDTINISVMYVNKSSRAFIDNALVTINGSGVSKVMPDNGFNNYTILINTTELSIYGNNYLTIEASRRYYETSIITIKITVIDRPTYLEIALNGTYNSEFDYYNTSSDQLLNITAWYKEADNTTPIESATVELFEAGIGINTMPQHPIYDQYNITVNTTNLGVGVKFLSISAEKDNYTSRAETITIIIYERAAEVRIWLNNTEKTLFPTIELNVNETLNITATYRDFITLNHLSEAGGANVRIFGSGIDDNLTEYVAQEQYTYFLNTSDLAQGVNFVNVLAEKDGYESQVILLTIMITERNTTIEIFLNGTDFSLVSPIVYTLTIGELLNITIKYKDWLTNSHIELTSVDLEGEGLNKPLPENITLGHYSIILDSEELNRGVNFLTITAYKPNYQPRQKQIKIEIIDKASVMSLYINGENRTSDTFFNFFWGDSLNITAFYLENESKQLINEAAVQLVEGGNLLYNLTKNANYEQYNRTINTADLGVGIRSLLIFAAKENYETMTKSLIITVSERDTYLNILINDINASNVDSFNFSSGESLNITAWYKDYNTGDFIFSSDLELIGLAGPLSLIKHSQFNQYNLTILANDLNLGPNYLVINAQKDNYTNLSEPIIISISKKIAEFQLLIDGNSIANGEIKIVDVTQILNISVIYKDFSSSQFIPGAIINISGIEPSPITLDESPYGHYNITLNVGDLQDPFPTLILSAEKPNYQIQTFQFYLNIEQKQTNLDIFFNGINVTASPAITFPISSLLNLTVKYTSTDLIHILNANVSLSTDFTANLTEQGIYQQYYIIINTNLLKIGINTISLRAERPNYEIKATNLYITIRKISTNLTIWFDGVDVTIDPDIELPIGAMFNLTVNFTDEDGLHVSNAEVTLGTLANLTENNNQYSTIINTNLLDLGGHIISFTAYRPNYDIQTENIKILLRKIRTSIDTEDGDDTITIRPGEDVKIIIEIINLDFDVGIEDAEVTYDWKLGDGDLDEEGNGLYEFKLEDLPEGTYTITISVYKAGSKYDFEEFEITLIVKQPAEESLLFLILLIVAIIVGVALASYIIYYQRFLKYPKPVRKVRKYRKTLKKKKAPSVNITNREKAFKKIYKERFTSDMLKGKVSEEIIAEDKVVKKTKKSIAEKIVESSDNSLDKTEE